VLTYFRCLDGKIDQLDAAPVQVSAADPKALHWIDLEDSTPEEAKLLEKSFHPLAVEDCFSEVHHPKVDEYEKYLFIIVHGIRFDEPTDQFVTRKLDIFLGPNYLITHHHGPLRSITASREQCTRGLNAAMPRGLDFLLHQLLDQMFDHYFPTLDTIQDKIQLAEVEVFEGPTTDTLSRIFALKRDVMNLRRICGPQREILNRLSRGEFEAVSRKAAIYFRDIYDNMYRILDATYAYQDIVQGTLDAYLSSVNNALNHTMQRLTVIGAMLMPLTLITGIYGMNFKNMPELDWQYGYVGVLGLMVVVSIALVSFFRRKGWI